ncbi:endo alpha-1,4 polygalactosaminidase precursor [Dactylonectria estremocensis]|uniref:alpha-galactosidase n=1 Tax=Dactylonectria estremocensis TaxID=1079267 RepID=A0A9P9DZN1_9HYPO|nr:endo alpha-1,4 polygalactosaminidase precursor [Dactylonectria estremocensis]
MDDPEAPQQPWIPAVGTSWQIVLKEPLQIDPAQPAISPDVEVYVIDLFDNSAETIAALHSLGKKVICYFSAGTYEEWRPDASEFAKADLGKAMDDWPGERWLDLKSENVRNIMAKRIKLAAEKGCDAIDPDNVDGYDNKNGLGLKKADSIDFMKFLSFEASKYGLSIGLKNAGEIIDDVIDDVHFQVNEECVKYNEGRTFARFIKAGKAVFHIEATISNAKGTDNFSTVLKKMDLDGWVQFCDGQEFTTKTGY